MKRTINLLANAMRIGVVTLAVVAISLCLHGCSSSAYSPWTDLSEHYDLSKVEYIGDNVCGFNSYEINRGLLPYVSSPLNNNEYFATVLGQKVVLRSHPKVSQKTAIGTVNTGDHITVQGIPAEYVNGKYWNTVYVNSGYSAGRRGYICNDYLIEQEKYQVLEDYVFSSHRSNITYKTESKYLNAIGDILLKLEVNKTKPSLSVDLVDSSFFGEHVVVIYHIYNWDSTKNSSLLAYVEFSTKSNDYVVLGIVPGSSPHSIMLMPNGSYEITFTLK